MATVRENLIAAKALIDTPEKWVKGAARRGSCYCALGAIGTRDGSGMWNNLHIALSEALPNGEIYVARFNDDPSTTHADIMALFDRAIAALPLHEGNGE